MKKYVQQLLCGGLCVAMLWPALASAEENCKIFDDVGDKCRIGRHALGTPMMDLMTQEELRACIDQNQASPTCEYYDDETGVFAIARETRNLEETVVEYINANGEREQHLSLIAGIEFGDTIYTVGEKLRKLPDGFPQWIFRFNANQILLHTADCLRADNGTIWEYLLAFSPDGKLSSVEASMKGYEFPL